MGAVDRLEAPPTLAAARDTLRSWLVAAFDLWWERGADRARGGFHERLHLDGTPTEEPRRARLHPRQVFVFAHAPPLGWGGPGGEAVEHGLSYFLDKYRRPDGLIRACVGVDGAPLDERAVLYDQAFALLGLAAGYEALRDSSLRTEARALRDRLRERFALPGGAFAEMLPYAPPVTSNSHMHLLEASLEWSALDADAGWLELASGIVRLALGRWIDGESGPMREYFDENGRPMRGEQGRLVDPGHQYEWAWLLLQFAAHRPEARLQPRALQLIALAEKHGVDRSRGVVVNALLDDLSVHDAGARLWLQTERLRAVHAAASLTGDVRYEQPTLDAACSLLRYLDVPLRGLWRDRMRRDGSFDDEPAPASSLYHLVGAISALADPQPRGPSAARAPSDERGPSEARGTSTTGSR